MELSGRTIAGALGALILSAAAAAHDVLPPPRTVSVNGQGEVSVKPDRARLSLSVQKLDLDLKKAEADVNKVVRDFVKEAKALGTKDDALSTTGVSIHPEYTWNEAARQQKFVGYRVTRQIEVRIDNLDRLGDYVLKATAVGVNQVNAPMLESSKAPELERQALVKATEDARGKAKLLADTLGVKLGMASAIAESSFNPQPMVEMKMRVASQAAAPDDNADMGIALGEIRYRATVSAQFDLLPP